MFWPLDKSIESVSMGLKGTLQDRVRIQRFLDRFVPGIRVADLESGGKNALRDDIVHAMDEVANGCPPLVVTYFQGHSEGSAGPLRYITGDHNEGGKLKGFTAQELVKMFSKLSIQTMAMAITDFCNSGNIYRLRFRLAPNPDGTFSWTETREWQDDQRTNKVPSITSPMIHIAGSLEWQLVYETGGGGGYFTNSLADLEAGPVTLPQFLMDLQRRVEIHVGQGKSHSSSPLPRAARQVPQIYSSCNLPLDDPEIFSKIRDGTAKSFYCR
ncbi:unnamed protein product [Rhizoctonia solani]|uniref:Peptidase C14 caspase domain-containing protein n=1 Tax=Rhizoctonia solani TaxID=456999 RepID=A0A8H3GMH2_9AGAM|nr:unnamed protein product [Rhizoctonia solani]